MASKRDVRCRTCGRVWSSGAKAEDLKCNKECKSVDIEDNFVDPEKSNERTALELAQIEKYGEALYDRCRKVIGLTDVQISAHPDAESLKQYANGIHPKSNPDARVKEGVRPEPPKFAENMPDKFELESVLEAKFIKSNRDHFDRSNLQGLLRRINRKYGNHDPVRIVTDQSCKVVKRELITKFTIIYKE